LAPIQGLLGPTVVRCLIFHVLDLLVNWPKPIALDFSFWIHPLRKLTYGPDDTLDSCTTFLSYLLFFFLESQDLHRHFIEDHKSIFCFSQNYHPLDVFGHRRSGHMQIMSWISVVGRGRPRLVPRLVLSPTNSGRWTECAL